MGSGRRFVLSVAFAGLIVSCSLVVSYDADTNGVCPAGTKPCGDRCVPADNPQTGCANPSSCAPCALPKAAQSACGADGQCAAERCAPGYGDCDHHPENGCEADLDNDPDNCSSCGRACKGQHASWACGRGECSVVACEAGYGNCDLAFQNGCETQLGSDTGNCGRCGRACAPGRPCVTGICLAASLVSASPSAHHACATMNTGTAVCWGANASSQLGNNATCPPLCVTTTAQSVRNLLDVVSLATGGSHTCAATRSGGVYCWGSNSDGQLGLGTPADGVVRAIPVKLPTFAAVTAITAGAWHTCALDREGTVWCWGRGLDGQTGNPGAPSTVISPTQVKLGSDVLRDVVAISAGSDHTCALLRQGLVYCWGDNRFGQLGTTSPTTSTCGWLGGSSCAAAPVAMNGVNDAVAVSSGGATTCVLRRGQTNSVWCTGSGKNGALGNGGQADSPVPVAVSAIPGMTDLQSISVGGEHACAVTANGLLWCWGSNARGQLFGDPSEAAFRTAPVLVGSVAGSTQVAAGRDFTCLVLADNVVNCAGDNAFGQIGQGTVPDSFAHYTPAKVNGLP